MYAGFYEEGDICPECHKGVLEYSPVENCSCHINPPCSACTDRFLLCPDCNFEPDEPDYKDVPITPFEYGVGISMREYKPKPLDNTEIDYHTEMHTHFSQKVKGVYPAGTTPDEVRKAVGGTFGGRFTYFQDGKFEFIAYTD